MPTTILLDRKRVFVVRQLCSWFLALCFLSTTLFAAYKPPWTDKRVRPPDEKLERLGYPCDTREQVEAALESTEAGVPVLAAELLAERGEQASIPKIKNLLVSEHLWYRITAARALRKLGDESGLHQMRVDLQKLIPSEKEGGETALVQKADFLWHRGKALDVSLVLAEYGDNRGYNLAARVALECARSGDRQSAIPLLAEITRTSKDRLGQNGLDPWSVLEKMAATEKNELVQSLLAGIMAGTAGDLDPAMASKVLRILANSPHVPERHKPYILQHAKELPARFEKQETDRD